MSLLERLFPPRCLLCGDPGTGGLALCAGCRGDLAGNGPACVRCAARLPATGPGLPELSVCGPCLWRPPPYAAIHVPFAYAAPIDWLVHRFKFHGDLAAGRLLGGLLAGALPAPAAPVDAVVPVPLHPRRLRERGFNQAAELARPLAHAVAAPLLPDALQRVRASTPQMGLPAARRRGNVRHAFAAPGAAPGPHVLLVDDVVTTASTVREAARRLAAAGSARVTVVAVARA